MVPLLFATEQPPGPSHEEKQISTGLDVKASPVAPG